MRNWRTVVPAVGLLTLVAGCATTGANGSSLQQTITTPEVERLSRQEQVAWRDSVYAQGIADQQGPRASIRAQFTNIAGSRRARAIFHVDDDAYVVIGHIDADGVLRFAFPLDPRDDGLVHGGKTYETEEFFAGFLDQFRYNSQSGLLTPATRRYDAYDATLGYAFIIASWRPMRLDRFQTDGRWDSFELANDEYLKDPRPAIYELASLLAGANRETYTVEFARYTTTQPLYADYGESSALGYAYCLGSSPLGYSPYGFAPLGYSVFGVQSFAGGPAEYGQSFYSRGTYYYYDFTHDCYRRGYPTVYYASGFGGGVTPGPARPPTPARVFDLDGKRSPFTPRDVGEHALPGGRLGPAGIAPEAPRVSPTYRQRGLITTDDPTDTPPTARRPRIEDRSPAGDHARPPIQQMLGRRLQGDDNTSAQPREPTRGGHVERPGFNPETRRSEPRAAETRGYRAPEPRGEATRPAAREPTPVYREPRVPTPEPRSMPAASPPPRSAPPPPSKPADPPSSSSGSASSHPTKPPVS